jgi:dihydrodipicolinate synthase/N-acetylneuraminate lyase
VVKTSIFGDIMQIPSIKTGRKITGMSAILLPFQENGDVDWIGFEQHLIRTVSAGLIPAVNMDTGYANLIDESTRLNVLKRTASLLKGQPYIAGAFVKDQPHEPFSLSAYQRALDPIQTHGGTPIIFQSYGLTQQDSQGIYHSYEQIARECDRFLAFELGQAFAPFGKIYELELYEQLLKIPACYGAKHSSLKRTLEWQRLNLRDRVRPEFLVLTGNDLAIDMVMYGSDYLLGLSTFCPEHFAKRDRLWANNHPNFYELNDLIQYLGFFAFRPPVPAYKHSAAMFLHLRGWILCPQTHPQSPSRPESDREVLRDIMERLNEWTCYA